MRMRLSEGGYLSAATGDWGLLFRHCHLRPFLGEESTGWWRPKAACLIGPEPANSGRSGKGTKISPISIAIQACRKPVQKST